MASNGGDTHLFEPIAQLVYRGSSTTDVGITNDDAQSFVFDDTNLFSYNRFSGIDRQETGLRANLGGHYRRQFRRWQLARPHRWTSPSSWPGLNAFGVTDTAQVGTATGLGCDCLLFRRGRTRRLRQMALTLGGKLQVDPATPARHPRRLRRRL